MQTLMVTVDQATVVHISNISAILTQFWPNFLDPIFWGPWSVYRQHFFNQTSFDLNSFVPKIFLGHFSFFIWIKNVLDTLAIHSILTDYTRSISNLWYACPLSSTIQTIHCHQKSPSTLFNSYLLTLYVQFQATYLFSQRWVGWVGEWVGGR